MSAALRESFRTALDARRNAQAVPVALESTLFARFVFYFDGFVGGSDESLMSLHRAVRAHSALVASFLTRSVTHIVASSLAASKLNRRMTSHRGTPAHLVRPDWIADSISARKLLPTAAYRPAAHLIAPAAALDLHPITRWFAVPPPLTTLLDNEPIRGKSASRRPRPSPTLLMPLDENRNRDARRRKRERIDRALGQLAATQTKPSPQLRKAQN